jgi:hemolysin-activating ACP:hemolysin acyltransferase
MFDEIKTIISLYRRFDRYKRYSDKDLLFHILPSYQLKQYKLHKQGDEVIAFTNWAFLNNDAQNRFISTTFLKPNDWKSGDNVWHIDTICVKNIRKVMSWTKEHFRKILKVNQPLNWLRIDNNGVIYRKASKFKREFHNKGKI